MIADPGAVEWLESAPFSPDYRVRQGYLNLFRPQFHRRWIDLLVDYPENSTEEEPLIPASAYRHGLPVCMACYDAHPYPDDVVGGWNLPCDHNITDGGVQWLS